MIRQTQKFFLPGTAGNIECALDLPEVAPISIALIAHPHPLHGGTMDNKVVQTLNRAFVAHGYAVARLNFRSVRPPRAHDEGAAKPMTPPCCWLMKQQYPGLPVALAGFSFGTFVQACLQQRLTAG